MSQQVTLHHVGDPRVDHLTVHRLGAAGSGGAHHNYRIFRGAVGISKHIKFQRGPVCEGVNGITNETLLAIVADRLQGFQSGPMPCDENRDALTCVQSALFSLQRRTRRRLETGVEGRGRP